MKYLLSLLLILLPGCSWLGFSQSSPSAGRPAPRLLNQLADTYASKHIDIAGPAGFVDVAHCDSLQQSALMAAAGLTGINVKAAEDPGTPGHWYRRPTSLPECWASGQSRSTISRDQLYGVMWWAWTYGRADVIRDMWAYGYRRDWFMGDGRLQGVDTLMNQNAITLLAKLCVALKAHCEPVHRVGLWAMLPLTWGGAGVDYERQLEILQIGLAAEIDGDITPQGLQRLTKHATERPDNPLFAVALARWGELDPSVVDDILEARGYPLDRLPDNRDWCHSWPVVPEVWPISCSDVGEPHSGGEVVFMRRLIEGKP